MGGSHDAISLGVARFLKRQRIKETVVANVIAEHCVDLKDKTCLDECPVDGIHEGERMLFIQPDECIDCNACEMVRPVEAIYYVDGLSRSGSTISRSTQTSSTFSDLPAVHQRSA
jgi:NAD-dependent dihydropyrimidine dehydrogenase PreA subunit